MDELDTQNPENGYYDEWQKSLDDLANNVDDNEYDKSFPSLQKIRKTKRHMKNPFCQTTMLFPGFVMAQGLGTTIIDWNRASLDSRKVGLEKKVQKEEEKRLRDKYNKLIREVKNNAYVQLTILRDAFDGGVYIKLYYDGIKALSLMDTAAKRVFAGLLLQLMGSTAKESIYVVASYDKLTHEIAEYNSMLSRAKYSQELKKKHYVYSREIMDRISFPADFISYEIYKRGIKSLQNLTFDIPHSTEANKCFPGKVLYKTKRRGFFYINPRVIFNGSRHLYVENKGKLRDTTDKKIREIWGEGTITPGQFEYMCQDIPLGRYAQPFTKVPAKVSRLLTYSTPKKMTTMDTEDIYLKAGKGTKYKDAERFIKLYREGLVPILSLGKNGMLVLCDIFYQLLSEKQKTGQDLVIIYYTDEGFLFEPKHKEKTKEKELNARYQAFYKGIQECLAHSLICHGSTRDEYFINPVFFFSGDRKKLNITFAPNSPKGEKDKAEHQEQSLFEDLDEELLDDE